MPDIGIIEVTVVLLVALFAIGPERMPEVARYLVKAKKTLNKITSDIKSVWENIDTEDEEEKSHKSHDDEK